MLGDAAERAARKALIAGASRSSLGLAAQIAYDRLSVETAGEEDTVNLLALTSSVAGLKELLLVLKAMTGEELTEVVTMPSGKIYNYWRDGVTMTAAERIVRGHAKRELARRS
jgi:hypothetical protein